MSISGKTQHFLKARLGVRLPIVQGPMNGASPPALVSAVSAAGALGSLAASLLSPEEITQSIGQIRRSTNASFAVNLFILRKTDVPAAKIKRALEILTSIHAELGLQPPCLPPQFGQSFDEQFESILQNEPPVASFTFGLLTKSEIKDLKRKDICVIGTATHLKEALAWQDLGADAICLQGGEAGGHRATFIGSFEQAMNGTLPLCSLVASRINLPCIAAGGLMQGHDIVAALSLGCAAGQLGTAFLGCPEAGIAKTWRNALIDAWDTSTEITSSFSGRPARGIRNLYIERMKAYEHELPGYPYMNELTTPLRKVAAASDDNRYLSMWAGQGLTQLRTLPAMRLIETLELEMKSAMHRLVNHDFDEVMP